MIRLVPSQSENVFMSLLSNSRDNIFLCSPFVKEPTIKKVMANKPSGVPLKMLSRMRLDTFAQGSSDLNAFKILLDNGVDLFNDPALHAKVYLFDSEKAIVSSANLTPSGFYRNDEVGLLVDDPSVVSSLQSRFKFLLSRSSSFTNADLKFFENSIPASGTSGGPIDEDLLPYASSQISGLLNGYEKEIFDFLDAKLIIPDFKLADAYQAEHLLSRIYPNNHHIKDKIRQVLQCLRNKGLIAFDSRGNYRALWKK